jgi:hypothetical protein
MEVLVRAKDDCFPLFKKGDLFKITQINEDPELMPIEAIHINTKDVYGFEKEELQEAVLNKSREVKNG